MSDNVLIKERLEYLKNYAYEELNRLKIKILNNEECNIVSNTGHDSIDMAAESKSDTDKKEVNPYLKHKMAMKRINVDKSRKYKK